MNVAQMWSGDGEASVRRYVAEQRKGSRATPAGTAEPEHSPHDGAVEAAISRSEQRFRAEGRFEAAEIVCADRDSHG
jgi:hypothetical protein